MYNDALTRHEFTVCTLVAEFNRKGINMLSSKELVYEALAFKKVPRVPFSFRKLSSDLEALNTGTA